MSIVKSKQIGKDGKIRLVEAIQNGLNNEHKKLMTQNCLVRHLVKRSDYKGTRAK